MRAERIDVHQHFLPPEYVQWLHAHGITEAGGRDLPAWSAEQAVELMTENGIATGVLSISTPGVHLGDDREASAMARPVNEFGAALVKDQPSRFGFFASLPLPDVDGAIAAAVHALDDLAADGVVLLANVRGQYLGDVAFEPLLAELDRRGAVVFIHPSQLPGPAVPGIPPFAADFLLDTTRAAINLVRNGALHRYPQVKFILSHAGGFLPYASQRIIVALAGATGRGGKEIMEDLSGFYFDTALSAGPAVLPSLLAFARPGHVLFGSDWPFAPAVTARYFTRQLDGYAGLDDQGRAAINRTSAEVLFPRLMNQPG